MIQMQAIELIGKSVSDFFFSNDLNATLGTVFL